MIDERNIELEATASAESSEEASEEELFVKEDDPLSADKFLLENNLLKEASTFSFFQEAFLTKIIAEATNLSLSWDTYKASVPTFIHNLEIPLLAIQEMFLTYQQEASNFRSLRDTFASKESLASQDSQHSQPLVDISELTAERDTIKLRLLEKEKQLAELYRERKVSTVHPGTRVSGREKRRRQAQDAGRHL